MLDAATSESSQRKHLLVSRVKHSEPDLPDTRKEEKAKHCFQDYLRKNDGNCFLYKLLKDTLLFRRIPREKSTILDSVAGRFDFFQVFLDIIVKGHLQEHSA